MIQRHASWEHRLLGDVTPNQLVSLGSVFENLKNDAKPQVAGTEIERDQATHVLEQEIRRLKIWQENPPQSASNQDRVALRAVDPEWNVRLVEIPSHDPHRPPVVVTYGELNTLADFYGSVDELKSVTPSKRARFWPGTATDDRQNVVQSVRRQSFEKLLLLYERIMNFTTKQAKRHLGVEKLKFRGAFNITDAVSGEIAQMKLNKKGETDDASAYGATLARNACHFAPESWHSWAEYHNKALVQAGTAYRQRVGHQVQTAAASANEARLLNGFGDHYLQDSYAAGHLINKTQIMQWFVQWLDQHPDKWNYSTPTTWRQFQAIAYAQPGLVDAGQYDKTRIGSRPINGVQVPTARNPQLVENTKELRDPAVRWQQRFEILGLRTPPSVTAGSPALRLLLPLQEQAGYLTSWTLAELRDLATRHHLSEPEFMFALRGLVGDHVLYQVAGDREARGEAYRTGRLTEADTKYTMRKEYVVSLTGEHRRKFRDASADASAGNMVRYNTMMQATVSKDFVAFLRDSFLQKATNKLHDHFCLQGLDVATARGRPVFRVYGDNSMLTKGSGAGVHHAAESSNWSRDAVEDKIMNNTEPHTTDDILARLPAMVRLGVHDEPISLEEWHNEGMLRQFCYTTIFPHLDTYQELGAGVAGGSLGTMSADEKVHTGEAF